MGGWVAARVRTGNLSQRDARASKRLTVVGPTDILRNLSSWLPLSVFAGIEAGNRKRV